jgi:hypothetical protein
MKNILNNLKSPNYLSDLFYYDESEGKIKANTGVIGTGVLCDEAAWDQLL